MKDYRWSRFNFLLNHDNKRFTLYNSFTNGLIEVDQSMFLILKRIKELDCNACFNELTKDEVDFYIKNFILVKDDDSIVEMLHNQSMERIYNKKHLVLTIAPTIDCNFDCVYCFEKNRDSGLMNQETENSIINNLIGQKAEFGLESLSLTWYGGEPLLAISRLESIAKRINDLNLQYFEHEVITNGYLLNEKNIKILSDIGVISIQITIDGFKQTHDQRRPHINGEGSFDAIISNLDNLFNGVYSDRFDIALRVNVDKNNISEFNSIYNWLNERYNSKRLFVYPGWVYLDDSSPSKCTCFNRNEATDICLDLYNKGIRVEEVYPDIINMECLIRNTNSLTIGYNGDLYKCYEDMGETNSVVGNIHDSSIWSNMELISKYSIGIDHYQDVKCRKCPYLPICRGGCPKRRYENKYLGKNNDCCTPFKGRIKEYIALQLCNE